MNAGQRARSALVFILALVLGATLMRTIELRQERGSKQAPAIADLDASPPQAPLGALRAGNEDRRALEQPEEDLAIEEGTPEPATTARMYLQEYWGDRWPEIEQAMLKAKIDLDQPYEPVPWEVASRVLEPMALLTPEERDNATVKNICRWPTDLEPRAMLDWIRNEYLVPSSLELDTADLLAIEDNVRGSNEELKQLADEYFDRIDFYTMEKWNSGDFVKAPFGTIGVSKTLGFHSKTAAASGWSFVITLQREQYPDMVELQNRAALLREKRDQAVAQYLLKRRGK